MAQQNTKDSATTCGVSGGPNVKQENGFSISDTEILAKEIVIHSKQGIKIKKATDFADKFVKYVAAYDEETTLPLDVVCGFSVDVLKEMLKECYPKDLIARGAVGAALRQLNQEQSQFAGM